MKKTGALIAMVGVIAANLHVAVAAPDAVRVPGTQVSLRPPAGFTVADRFPGFQNTTEEASIMVSEFPGALRERCSRCKRGWTPSLATFRGRHTCKRLSRGRAMISRLRSPALRMKPWSCSRASACRASRRSGGCCGNTDVFAQPAYVRYLDAPCGVPLHCSWR